MEALRRPLTPYLPPGSLRVNECYELLTGYNMVTSPDPCPRSKSERDYLQWPVCWVDTGSGLQGRRLCDCSGDGAAGNGPACAITGKEEPRVRGLSSLC